MQKKVSVIIRVYDRIDDLSHNLHIISQLWTKHDYHITVVFNGQEAGYELTEEITANASHIINLEQNAGHLKGNSQLILEAHKQQTKESDFTILLEADTWLMNDTLIDTYIHRLSSSDAVWASSEWVEARWSLGLDFILMKSSFFQQEGLTLFNFEKRPEMSICETLLEKQFSFIYITELMPVHRPSLIKSIYNADGGRIRLFPRAYTLTHHIEDLKGGMAEKLYLADIMRTKPFFTMSTPSDLLIQNVKYRLIEFILRITPRSTWFKKKRYTFKGNTISK